MYSRFPLSLENIPRSSGFLCLSLKLGCVLTSLIYIVYSTLGLAVCVAALSDLNSSPEGIFILTCIAIDIVSHGVTFILSFILLLGLLKDKAKYIRPWILWTTFQTLAYISVFIVLSTVQMINHVTDASFYMYFLEFLMLAGRVYMLVLVASFYKQLIEIKEEEEKFQQLMSQETWYTVA